MRLPPTATLFMDDAVQDLEDLIVLITGDGAMVEQYLIGAIGGDPSLSDLSPATESLVWHSP